LYESNVRHLRITDEKDFLNELGLLKDAVNYYYIPVLGNE